MTRAIADLPLSLFPVWVRHRPRVTVIVTATTIADGHRIAAVGIRNAGSIQFVVQAVGGLQHHRRFAIDDERLPFDLDPGDDWVFVPARAGAGFSPLEPWIALVWEPGGVEHRSR